MADEIKPVAWMRLIAGQVTDLTCIERPGYHPLYFTQPAPEAEKLRVVVEALQCARAILINTATTNAMRLVGAHDVIAQALAALQAEQKGGA